MAKRIKIAVLLLAIYLVVFVIGFKSGAMYFRMKKVETERIALPPPFERFFIIERTGDRDDKGYVNASFREANPDDVIIKMFKNEKMRPLLKSGDREIEIYNSTGERIY